MLPWRPPCVCATDTDLHAGHSVHRDSQSIQAGASLLTTQRPSPASRTGMVRSLSSSWRLEGHGPAAGPCRRAASLLDSGAPPCRTRSGVPIVATHHRRGRARRATPHGPRGAAARRRHVGPPFGPAFMPALRRGSLDLRAPMRPAASPSRDAPRSPRRRAPAVPLLALRRSPRQNAAPDPRTNARSGGCA